MQNKIRLFEEGQQNKKRLRRKFLISIHDYQQHEMLTRVSYLEQENGDTKKIGPEIFRRVLRRTQIQLAQTCGTNRFLFFKKKRDT